MYLLKIVVIATLLPFCDAHRGRQMISLSWTIDVIRSDRVRRLVTALVSCAIVITASARDAPSLLLANVLGPDVDVTRYLVSEKYDGVRAFWDGKALRFRSGKTIAAPSWFVAKLPAESLDGELWFARGKFDEVSGIVRKDVPIDDEWRRVNYMIFELPQSEATASMVFAERVKKIEAVVARAKFPQLKAVPHYRVGDRAALKRELDRVVRAGGEGLMLHLADAPYVTGRSDALLKLKPLLDTEAKVIEHIPGKGKYAGKMGALLVETSEGVRFKLGTGFSDEVRTHPPPIGSSVTYTYRDLTKNGKPRFASFLRIRDDP